ncbi:MAG: flavodoxin [bacterium]|nr:flavodoxin [bacterium]
MTKNLIVYYSYEGNTEALVDGMKSAITADVLKLVPKKEKKTNSLFRFVWGGIQVYMTKKPKLEEYNVDLDKYDNIIIASPCWFGTFAPPIKTFLTDNKLENKNIYLLVCNGGNLRGIWKDYEEILKGNKIISKLDLVYPIKNGIEDAKKKTNEWIGSFLNK